MQADIRLYLQITQKIEAAILSGRIQPGQRLPAIRELASYAQVNPNTVQKAVSELKRMGLVEASRSGQTARVTPDTLLIQRRRQEKALEQVRRLKIQLLTLGYQETEITDLVSDYI